MQLPRDLIAALESLRPQGHPLLVGGCVRDWLDGCPCADFDVEVRGIGYEELRARLAALGPTDVVGRAFGVVKVRLASGVVEFALPRTERREGEGHRGFDVSTDPGLPFAEAAARRDFTVNAMGWDPFRCELLDPLGGAEDLRARVLRHAGPAFADDPLRVLRAFQFAARFNMGLAPESASLCRSILARFSELPVERVWGEWYKWAAHAVSPARGIDVLRETGWIEHFPEVAAMAGVPQDPEWHPEGDVLAHTGHCLEALARMPEWREGAPDRRARLMLAVLAHDFGKVIATVWSDRRGRQRWRSPGHDHAGARMASAFLGRIGAPGEFHARICPLVGHHLSHHDGPVPPSDSAVRRLARRLEPATLDDLMIIWRADDRGRPGQTEGGVSERISAWQERVVALAVRDSAPGPLLLGRHLIAAGLKPGPRFKPVLDAAYEAQLDGCFTDEAGALLWLAKRKGALRDGDGS